jgi:hypothetical protein
MEPCGAHTRRGGYVTDGCVAVRITNDRVDRLGAPGPSMAVQSACAAPARTGTVTCATPRGRRAGRCSMHRKFPGCLAWQVGRRNSRSRRGTFSVGSRGFRGPGGCALAVLSMSKQEFSRLNVLLRVQSGCLRVGDACVLISLQRASSVSSAARPQARRPASLLSKRRGRPSNHRLPAEVRVIPLGQLLWGQRGAMLLVLTE